jgi:nucleoid-associated protein YgaU
VKVPDPGNLAMPNLTGTPPAAASTVPPVVVPTTPAAGTPSPAVPTPDPFPLRPAGSTVSPTASSIPDSVTKTDFDVDLHYSRAGESFGTIAKKHYGDERYGTALASFNGTPGGAPDRIVQIPPFSVLKKYAAGGAIPAPAAVPVGTDRTMDWMPSTAGTVKTYTIPATTTGQGMTFKDIARAAYGTDQDWQRVFDLNPQFSAGAVLPPGTKVRLSSDAKVGQ